MADGQADARGRVQRCRPAAVILAHNRVEERTEALAMEAAAKMAVSSLTEGSRQLSEPQLQ